jgi:hypothetical protein
VPLVNLYSWTDGTAKLHFWFGYYSGFIIEIGRLGGGGEGAAYWGDE